MQGLADLILKKYGGEQLVEPLTADDLDRINTSLNALTKADEIIKRAEVAGLDVGDQRDRSDALRKKFQGIKQAFFPGE